MNQAWRRRENRSCSTLRPFSDPKDRDFSNKKNREIQKGKIFLPVNYLSPLALALREAICHAITQREGHSRLQPGPPCEEAKAGFQAFGAKPGFFHRGSAHPKATLTGDDRTVSANNREASNVLPQRELFF